MGLRARLQRIGTHRGTDDIENSFGLMDLLQKRRIVHRTVTDCGLHPNPEAKPGEEGYVASSLDFLRDGKLIDVLQLTHAHLDHVGHAPALMPYMARNAKVYATKTTAEILNYGYRDAIKIAGYRKSPAPYTEAQVDELMSRIRTFNRPGVYEIPGAPYKTLVHPAGHVPGACSFTMKIGTCTIHYAGDRCTHDQPGTRGAPPLPPDWKPKYIAGSDCTSGSDFASDFRSWQDEATKFHDEVAAALKRNSFAQINAFAFGRGPLSAHELRRRGINTPGVIHIDGGCRYYAKKQLDPAGGWCELDSPLDLWGVQFVDGSHREQLSQQKGIAMVTSGGMGGGASIFYRRNVLADPDAAMIFTGYVARGTDGHKILMADAERKRTGTPAPVSFEVTDLETGEIKTETYMLRCRVSQFRLSGHASRQETINWFREINPEVAVLSHGSVESLESLAKELSGDINTVRADLEPSIEIDC